MKLSNFAQQSVSGSSFQPPPKFRLWRNFVYTGDARLDTMQDEKLEKEGA